VKKAAKAKPFRIGESRVRPGSWADVMLKISETYTGAPVSLPAKVFHAAEPGPAVFLIAAVHGDEINGVGVIREIFFEPPELLRGTLVCVPVANIFGFEGHTRYLPDRRDLNRSFPGSSTGSLALRLAHILFHEVVSRCQYGIDLHTATIRRTNFPHVRADLANEEVRRIAFAFGCEVILNGEGPRGSLRSEAVNAGCHLITMEAGEAFKFEPGPIRLGVRGVRNVLRELGMLDGEIVRPAYQTQVDETTWVRSPAGGILRFHVKPGDVVNKGALLATCDRLYSSDATGITAPAGGVIIGMTTLPAVKPGEPVCHLAVPTRPLDEIRAEIAAAPKSLHRKLQRDLATNVVVKKVD
jgi:predicted deacylase